MWVCPIDNDFIEEHMEEIKEWEAKYEEMFGQRFTVFNYETFQAGPDGCTARVYLEELRKAVETRTPYLKKPTYDIDKQIIEIYDDDEEDEE